MALLSEVKASYGKQQFFINGEWVDSKSSTWLENPNPATGKPISEFPVATEEEARAAVEAADMAFKTWKNIPMRDRARYLFGMRAKFEDKAEELSRVLAQDHGRTIGEARDSVKRVIENIESACSAVYNQVKVNEHLEQVADGIDQYLTWEPLGAFLIITPGNIPMHAWSSFVPYALAAGCTVVVSPSRQDPVAAEYICRAAESAGLPPGVINMIHGGRHINQEILRQKAIKGLGFIGSNAAGKELFELCAKLGKPASINGNGKNNVVIMPDANLHEAARGLLRSCFGMSGQRCLGADNVILVGGIHKEFEAIFQQAAASMKVGYGLDEQTDLGPMTTLPGKEKVEKWIEHSLTDGARMILDGRKIEVANYPGGYFLGPTIIGDVNVDMDMAKEEAFGPVAALIRGDSLDQAIEWINTKTNLGHSACIFTSDAVKARRFTRQVNVGNVGVNVGVPQPFAFFPLGSRRESFIGSAKSRYGSMKLFMDEKTVCTRWV